MKFSKTYTGSLLGMILLLGKAASASRISCTCCSETRPPSGSAERQPFPETGLRV